MMRLGDHFRSDEARRHSEWLRQRQWFIKAKQEHERREKLEDRFEDELLSAAAEIVMATQMQIRRFETRLDTYDEATIMALTENREALEAVRERLEAYLARAYVMEDGRRVFRTEDGTQVFDEFGEAVAREELDFDLIGPERPTWEMYRPDFEARQTLEAERDAILDYQEKLDEAREEIADGDIAKADLEDLDAELLDLMPTSVREHAGIKPDTIKSDPETTFETPMIQTAAPVTHRPTKTSESGGAIAFTPGG